MSAETMSGKRDERLAGVQAVLMAETGGLSFVWLPAKPHGRYCFQDRQAAGRIYMEAYRGQWYLCCTSPGVLYCGSETTNSVPMQDHLMVSVEIGDFYGAVYMEEVNRDSGVWHHYRIRQNADIRIGRLPDNDIVYAYPCVSRHHAVIRRAGGYWRISDENSASGVYVNGERVREQYLRAGDVIYIVGLRVIMGNGFITVNDGNQRVAIGGQGLARIDVPSQAGTAADAYAAVGENPLFNRLPRRRTALIAQDVEIEGPPMSLNSNRIPLILRMGGSMVMGGASALSGHFTSLISSVLFPILTQKYTEKDKKEYEERRVSSYTAYLNQKEQEIREEQERERRILNENYPPVSGILDYTRTQKQLWERRKTDDDFLTVRLGYGERPMLAEIQYPKKRFDMDEDALEDRMYELAGQPAALKDIPIMTSLTENFVCGITGRQEDTLLFVKALLAQITILHSYDEVKTVFLLEKEMLERMPYIRYLPHAWNDQRTIRFLVTDNGEAYQVSDFLKNELAADMEKPRELKDILKERPYYVVFALSKRVFDSMEVLKDVMQQERSCGVSILTMFDELPKECSQVWQIRHNGQHSVVYLKEIEKSDESFRQDDFREADAARSMQIMANTQLKVLTQAYALPQTVTFLEMFGVGRAEQLDPVRRWRENNPIKSLSTPVGLATDGSPFCLDLHQKYEGPHGLIAGMTGSGKSEFILTYILSMAINYHPDEVAFILIDYKGGGLTDAFDNPEKGLRLPHLVGTITNLDGAAIQRSLISIQSELTRRQRVFRRAKSISDEGTMDIYQYQRLYRQRVVKEPMPHLFIISDEFAELKQQKPEFLDQLVSIARIGRSLGVHLILATQKPAGVVNEQIRSNTKFRVCLKVQDKADSMDMLKRPEAAELKETGRFYLQVGYNEFFALGQSAYSGAPYEPQDEVAVQKDETVQFLDTAGQVICTAKPEKVRSGTGRSQLVEIVQMLAQTAREQGIHSRQLWKEALPARLDASALIADAQEKAQRCERECEQDGSREYVQECAPVQAVLGSVDDPEQQEQFPLAVDLTHCRNLLIVGDAGSGKTTMLQTMLMQLSRSYGPERVNYYVLDYSSRMLGIFGKLPQCGAMLNDDNADQLEAFFGLIRGIVAERKKLFAELEVDGYDAACSVKPMPLILVMIDNYSGLGATKAGENIAFRLQDDIKEGLAYGIRYILTANHTNEVPQRIKQVMGSRISLHRKDRYDYGEMLGCRCSYEPPQLPGRGLCVRDGRPLEFQTAVFFADCSDRDRIQRLKEMAEKTAGEYQGTEAAKRLPRVDETETYEEFLRQFAAGKGIPLGYDFKTAKPVILPFRQMSMLSLYFGNQAGTRPVWENILQAAKREHMAVTIIRRKKNSCFTAADASEEDGIRIVDLTKEKQTEFWEALIGEMVKRYGQLKKYCEETGRNLTDPDVYQETFDWMCMEFQPMLIVAESFADLCGDWEDGMNALSKKIFVQFGRYHMYMVSGFAPGDDAALCPAFDLYNPQEMLLFFGGRYNKQTLTDLPGAYAQVKDSLPYNRFVMKYRDSFHALLMPCGEMSDKPKYSDSGDIFAAES